MPIDLETIEAVKQLCMVKFHVAVPPNVFSNIHWDYNGLTYWVCNHSDLPQPLRVRDAAIIFEVFGKVSTSECHLLGGGTGPKYADENILSSCWIEPSTNTAQEHEHWDHFR
jgi:hypothetical protein